MDLTDTFPVSIACHCLLFAFRALTKPIFQFLMVQALHMLFSLPGCSSSPSSIFMNVLVALLCLTLCDPMDYSLPGFSIHRIFHARILEWVAISFSTESSNLCLLHWQADSLLLSYQGSQRVCHPSQILQLDCTVITITVFIKYMLFF